MTRRPVAPAVPGWLLLAALLWPAAVRAVDAPMRLTIEPSDISLSGPRDRIQVVVTGQIGADMVRDLTASVEYAVLDPALAAVAPDGVVVPKVDGRTTLVARLGGVEARAPLVVEGTARPAAVSFRREVVPTLTRAGCNAGACHGAPTGKNGFRLSLRGFDPQLDHASLTRGAEGRRLDPQAPDRSLFLMKATAQVPHEGGWRLNRRGPHYAFLRDWVAQGAADDGPAAPALTGLDVFPPNRILDEPAASQQLRVAATFADGSRRDVTHLCRFSIPDGAPAVVGPWGRVDKRKQGEAVVGVEYLGRMATSKLLFRDAAPGFAWHAPPETNYIDRCVFAKLRLLRFNPAPLCTDAEFLRRVHLDAIGKPPTPDEVRAFLADPAADKRSRVIDALLDRPEFADWWAMKWADRLGCNQRFVGKIGALKYHEWIRQAMADDMPEDEWARTILTGSGGNYDHPAAGFYRRLRDPESRAEESAELFMGVRLQCARCHNHPGERWTQDDYYGLAAFFARVGYRDGPFFLQIYDKEETVYAKRDGEVVQPRTGQTMAPKYLGGPVAEIAPAEDRRETLARWLTRPDNPFFAKAAVNRIWYHLMGRGVVDPVDDMRSTNPPSNEELLDALADDFVHHGFDRKYLIRTILQSRTYQLSSAAPDSGPDEDGRFLSHYRVRLLQAEQLLDAVGAAAGSTEKFPGFPAGTSASALPDGEYKHPFLEAFGRPARAMACECERDGDTNFGEGLQMVSGRTLDGLLRRDDGRVARLIASGRPDEEVVEELFLASLCRPPTTEERQAVLGRLHKAGANRRKAAEDVLWALVNHKEFLFQH
jgi:hypothetical protein